MIDPLEVAIDRVADRHRFLLSHHPTCEYYDHHTFELYGEKLCLGCFVVYPVGAVSLSVLVALGVFVGPFAAGTTALYGIAGLLGAPIVFSKTLGWPTGVRFRILAKALLAVGLAVLFYPLVFRPGDRLLTALLFVLFWIVYVGYKGLTAFDDCEGCPERSEFPDCSGMCFEADCEEGPCSRE